MNRRILLPISFILLALLALTLAGCERDRPVEKQATAVPARGTVAPSATPAAGAPAAGETNATATAPTAAPAAAGEATPTAPAPASVTQDPAAAGAAAAGQATTYTVAAGDTLAAIAKKFGVTQAAIIEANNLADPNKLVLGQQLQIPGAAAAAGAAAGSAGAGSASSGAAASGATGSYVVQRNDTLGQIAQKHNTTVAALMELNGITNPDRIAVGQKLIVPGAGSGGQAASQPAATTGTTQTRSYTVQKGDTLLSIARRFGLTVKQLQAANNITNPDKIYPGQTLTIP